MGRKALIHDRDGQKHPKVTQERWQQGKVCDCRKSLTNIHANGPLARCEIDVVNTTRHGTAPHGLNIQQFIAIERHRP